MNFPIRNKENRNFSDWYDRVRAEFKPRHGKPIEYVLGNDLEAFRNRYDEELAAIEEIEKEREYERRRRISEGMKRYWRSRAGLRRRKKTKKRGHRLTPKPNPDKGYQRNQKRRRRKAWKNGNKRKKKSR